MKTKFGKLSYCGARRDDKKPCTCGMIWDIESDCPVAKVYSGDVGDDYPSIKLVDEVDKGKRPPGGIGIVAKPYMEKIVYWTIPQEVADEFAQEFVKRWNEYDRLKEIEALIKGKGVE